MVNQIRNLDSTAIEKWDSIFNTRVAYKLLYTLQIVEFVYYNLKVLSLLYLAISHSLFFLGKAGPMEEPFPKIWRITVPFYHCHRITFIQASEQFFYQILFGKPDTCD